MDLNISASIKAVLITVVSVFFAIFILPWALIGLGIMLEPNPPEPAIKYAEFPFEVVYEIDDEIVTVNDIYVCEYDGIGMNEGVGKYRKWKGYIKGTNKKTIYITEDSERTIYCNVGYAQYYMDEEGYPSDESITPNLYDEAKNPFDVSFLTQNEILELYNIKIISWKFSDPIENTFK